ncbi:MAG: hypothetical protein KDB90_10725 [Planctomycetes bacterium]|nr:hypothetical protein [Planctomycetota bacterium]
MNVKTGIIFLIFCVSLAAVIVGQRLQIRSVGFESAQLDRELRDLNERKRVLNADVAKKRDPARMIRESREAGLPLLPPEGQIKPLPGKKKEQEEKKE